MKTAKKTQALIILSLIFLCNPNINMFDILPDFIAYFLLYSIISESAYIVPYLEETRGYLKKLGIVTLVRIPCTLIVFTNMHTGRDIVPLFTLTFAVIEAILLFGAISNAANGLFYLGQRSNAEALLSGSSAFGIRTSAEGLKIFTFAFFFIKCGLNFLPELCLLTTYDPRLSRILSMTYPFLLLACFLTVLTLGIIWVASAIRYVKNVSSSCNLREEIAELAGEEKLELVKIKRGVLRKTSALSLIAVGSLFSFDLAFNNTNGVNILPRFIFILILLFAAYRLYESKRLKAALSVTAGLYTVFSLLNHYKMIVFSDNYDMLELLEREAAREAYLPIKVLSIIELLMIIPFAVLMAIGFIRFVRGNTGISPDSEGYDKVEASFHRGMTIKSIVLFSLIGLIGLGKCADAFLDAEIDLLYTHGGVIVASIAPWFGFSLILLSVVLVIYSFVFISSVKSEVKFKYDIEEKETRKGVFE